MSEQESSAYEIAVLYEEARRRREEGNSSGAFARYRRLLELAEERGDLRGRAELLAEVGDMYQRMCETVPARHWYEQALAQLQELGDDAGMAAVQLRLGEISLVEGSLTAAAAHFETARASGSPEVSALALAQLGSLALTQDRQVQGLTFLCEAYAALHEKETVRRLLSRWARDLTPTRFRRLLAKATADDSLREEIERSVL